MSISKIVSLLLGILLSLSVFAQPKQQSRIAELIPKQADNGKYGYVDSLDQWVIEPRFDTVSMFSYDGLAFVNDSSGWALIDSLGVSIADNVHPELYLNGITSYHVLENEAALDRRRIRSLRLLGDSIVLLHLDHGVLGTYPFILTPILIERSRSVLGVMLRLDGYGHGWKSISVGGVKVLYDEGWREVEYWVDSDTRLELTPDVAFAIDDTHETRIYELSKADRPRTFNHVVEPFEDSPKILIHRYYVDDTSSSRLIPVQGQSSYNGTRKKVPQKLAGQYLLTFLGDTLFAGSAETDFEILNKSLYKWGLPNVRIACTSEDYATCRALDSSLDFLNGVRPVYANSDSLLWIYKNNELQLRRLEDGGVLFRKSYPDLVHRNRSQFEQHPFVATSDSVYRLDRGNRPLAIYAIPDTLLAATARISNIRDARYYAIWLIQRYNSEGLNINLPALRNASGWLYHYVGRFDDNRYCFKPEGKFRGVYDQTGRIVIPPQYGMIGIRDSLFIVHELGSSKQGLFTYSGRELSAPKAGLRSFMPKGELTPYRLIDETYVLIDSTGNVRSDTFQHRREDRSGVEGQKVCILYDWNPNRPEVTAKSIVLSEKGELLSAEIIDDDIMCHAYRYSDSENGGMIKATRTPLGPVGIRSIEGPWLAEPTYDSILLVTDHYAIGRKNDSLYVESFNEGVTTTFPNITIIPTLEGFTFVRAASKTEVGPQLDPCGLGYEKDGALGPLMYSTCIAPDGQLIMPLTSEYSPVIFVNNAIQFFHRDRKASVFFAEGQLVDSLTFEKSNKAYKLEQSQVAMNKQLEKIPEEIHSRAKRLLDSLNSANPKVPFRMNFKKGVPWLTFTDADTMLVFDIHGKYLRRLEKHQSIQRRNDEENTNCNILSSYRRTEYLFSVDGSLLEKYPKSHATNSISSYFPKRTHSHRGFYGPDVLPANWRYIVTDTGRDLLWLCDFE